MNERLSHALSMADARKAGAAVVIFEKDVIAACDRCGKGIEDMADVGYMGAADRGSEECSPMMAFETVCATCEGSSVLS